jgi:iron complex outermembrane receptor protein
MSMGHVSAKARQYRLVLTSTALATVAQFGLFDPSAGLDARAETAAPPPSANQVEEVVVMAERRSESVQNVPISITAISSATIEKFDIQDMTDYAKEVPNVSFGLGVGGGGASFGQGVPGALGISIRGISGYETTAFYIDDTPLPNSLDPRILDTDHIEVLRGPQGTLFGASSMGGLIRVITKQPDPNTFSGWADAQGYGMQHGGAPGGDLSVVLNVPLLRDFASARVAAFDSYTPGFFKRTYDDPAALNVTGQPVAGPARVVSNVGAVHEEGVAVTFRLTPVDGLVLSPSVRWQKTTGDGFPLADYDSDNLVQRRILNVPEGYQDEFVFAALTGSYTTPFGRFVSSTSWFNREYNDTEDGTDANSLYLSPTLLLAAPSIGISHTKTFTEEDRFESNFNFPVQVVAGVFYQITDTNYINNITQPGLTSAPDFLPTNTVFNLLNTGRQTQLAGFVGLTYKPIPPLEIAIGGRESRLTNDAYAFSDGIFGTGGSQTGVTDSSFTPRFSAKYHVSPQTMVYATVAQGFCGGGANPPIGSACGGFGFSTTEQIPYGSDTLWSYEGGVKSTFLGNRVSVSADYYHIDWSRIQQTEVLSDGANACFAGLTLNLGSAVSDGSEVEADARITDRLSVHMSAGYEDARLTKVVPGTEYYIGEPLSGVPKWTTSESAEYDLPQEWGNYFIRGQYSFTGQSISYTEVATGLVRKAYQLVDLRLGVNYHACTFTLFAKNLFDARPNLSDEVPVSALTENRYRYLVGPPREVGVDIRYRF